MPAQLNDRDRKYIKIFILLMLPVGLFGILRIAYDAVYVYPLVDKLELLVDSNKEYGDALKFVKMEGEVIDAFSTRTGTYFSVKPTVFEYNKDSIRNKKVFYKDSVGNIWFAQTGTNGQEIYRLKKGDWIKTDYGETQFKIIDRPKIKNR